MAAMLDLAWGPFLNRQDAAHRLCGFVDRACDASVGVVWSTGGRIYPLRAPTKQAHGLADVAIFHLPPIPRPPPPAPSGFLPRVKAFLHEAMMAQYRANMAQAQANQAMGQAVGRVFDRMIHTHRDDGLGVALDVLCIVASLAVLPAGAGLLFTAAGIAAIGGFALLGMDGYAYAMEMGGNDEGAEHVKAITEPYRIVATVMTLPDLFKGGYVAVKEVSEVVRALPRAEQTAATAERLAARTTVAGRAERYGQIAERAHLKAQIRREQIAGSLKHEIVPRASGGGSASLLIREEIQNEKSLYHQFVSRLQVHVTSISR